MRSQLLKLAVPLINVHGFTRHALSLSVLSLPTPHTQPLSDTAVSTLFGEGDDARRTLINAWLDDSRQQMKSNASPNIRMNDVLRVRLGSNEPVLQYLPEAFALLASPTSGIPLLDPRPALVHTFKIADEACHIVGDTTVGTSWYARRAPLAAIYTAAELHQLTSPSTAYHFLDSLLDASSAVKSSLNDAGTFMNYIGRSWGSIIRSSGILP